MSEFDLINQFFKQGTVKRDDVLLGIGDDCAILSPPPGRQLAVSTDTLISGVHFPENTAAEDIGYKSLAVNLSDLAAMGAEPAWASLAITLPAADQSWLKRFMLGFNELASKYKVALIGGDTTRGPLSITVNITGFVKPENLLRRNQAKHGDKIFVTGTLGDAGIGLNAVLNNLPLDHGLNYCIKRLNRPRPQIEAGLLLSPFSVAAIDISDGLLADLKHICIASQCGAIVNLENLPLSDALLQYYNNQPDWQPILGGGDDYELCFTSSQNNVEDIKNILQLNKIDISCIGEITDSLEVNCLFNNQLVDIQHDGYNHF